MFKSLSWDEYLVTYLIALAAYYGMTILLFYSEDLFENARSKPARPGTNPISAVAFAEETVRGLKSSRKSIAFGGPLQAGEFIQGMRRS